MNDAVRQLVSLYRRVSEEKMQGLPVFNERLSVEAVGFREWEGHLLGVVIAPWFMNLVIVPGGESAAEQAGHGSRSEWEFPAGRYAFHATDLDGAPLHLTTPLFAAVTDFPDQATARSVAEAVLEGLFSGEAARNPERIRKGGGDVLLDATMSRRSLLRRAMLMPD
jgi:[NiFe] hydrogenase assembly HybE family chaperone